VSRAREQSERASSQERCRRKWSKEAWLLAEDGMSPQSLREVSPVVIAGTKPFGYAIDEFIDTFYLDRGGAFLCRRARRAGRHRVF
jgi:hypothetical protein